MQRLQACLITCLVLLAVPAGMSGPLEAAPEAVLTGPSRDVEPAAGMLLVAQRGLADSFFRRSVILLLSHGLAGSQGLIVNQRSPWRLSDVLADIDRSRADNYPLFFGGPLAVHHVFMLMRRLPAVPNARQITDDIYFSDSRRALEDMLASKTPVDQLRFYMGYASWTTGQLQVELARGGWHLVKADAQTIFDTAGDELWERLINVLEPNGIEVRLDPSEPCCAAIHTAGSS